VVNGQGGHPRAPAGPPLPHHPEHRSVDVAQGGHGARLLGAQGGPLQEVVKDLQEEAHGAGARPTASPDGGPFGPEEGEVHVGGEALAGQGGRLLGRLHDPPHVVGHQDALLGGLLDHQHPVALRQGPHLWRKLPVDHPGEVLEGDLLLFPLGVGGGTHEAPDEVLEVPVLRREVGHPPHLPTLAVPLGAVGVQVDPVPAPHLGDQGQLLGHLHDAGEALRRVLGGSLDEAVEKVAVGRARPRQDAPTGGEALGGHELVELLLPVGPFLGLFGPGDLPGHAAEHAQDVPVPGLQVLPFGDGLGVLVKEMALHNPPYSPISWG